MGFRLKKGDHVVVISGGEKDARGTVLKVDRERDRVLIEGVNMVKRHQSPLRFAEGGIVEKEAWLHASNVALIDPESDKPTRIRYETRDGKKVRVAVKSGAVIE